MRHFISHLEDLISNFDGIFPGPTGRLARLRQTYRIYNRIADGLERSVLANRYGRQIALNMEEQVRRFIVTEEQFQEIQEFFFSRQGTAREALRLAGRYSGKFCNTYENLVQLKTGRGFSHLYEVDHLIEARIHRMLRDGLNGISSRQLRYYNPELNLVRETIQDGLSLMVPANSVVAATMSAHATRFVQRAGTEESRMFFYYYVHQGVMSKTTRMAELIPYGLEGEFSFVELLHLHLYALCSERNLPFRTLAPAIRQDFIDSILIGMEDTMDEGDGFTELIGQWLRQRPGALRRRIREGLEDEIVVMLEQRLPIDDLAQIESTYLASLRSTFHPPKPHSLDRLTLF